MCQAGVLTAAPLSLAGIFMHGGAEVLVCTCGTAGPDHDCPMHGRHRDHTGTQPDLDECVLRSASAASDVALVSLIGGIGLMPPAQTTSPVVLSAEPILTRSTVVLSRSERPESPPPRLLHRPVDIS